MAEGLLVTEDVQLSIATKSGPRIGTIDFVRGALVLLMVLYHWLAYFVSSDGDFFRYLRFVTPSFIFLAGFMVSHVYFAKQQGTAASTARRLAKRGLKLLLLFALLNVGRQFVVADARDGLMAAGSWSMDDLIASFVTGNVAVSGARATAFNILVPIGYLLLLCAGLAGLQRRFRHMFHVTAGIMLLAIVLLRLVGERYTMLDHVFIGLLGVIIGFLPLARIESVARRMGPLLVAYAAYLILVGQFGQTYPLYVAGVFVCLLLILGIGLQLRRDSGLSATTELLGRYSLFGYVVQIAILQLLFRLFSPGGISAGDRVATFPLAFLLTVLAIALLDRLRPRIALIDRTYRLLFA